MIRVTTGMNLSDACAKLCACAVQIWSRAVTVTLRWDERTVTSYLIGQEYKKRQGLREGVRARDWLLVVALKRKHLVLGVAVGAV